MGWERKRGKIEELNRLLRGATDTSFDVSGRRRRRSCRDVRYCITLDSDTRLPRDAAKTLDRHHRPPAQPAEPRPGCGRVTEGYGILQPRVSVTMASAAGSLFARLYAGHTGVDPYTTAVSDTYQDLFGEGIFTGKGLYDVDAFTRRARRPRPRVRAALARSLRGHLRAHRAGVRRRAGRRLPGERARPRAAPAPLGARRLADPALALPLGAQPARAAATQPASAHLALEDPRQPAAQPGARRRRWRCCSPPGPCCPAARRSGPRAVLAALAFPLYPLLLRRPARAPAPRAAGGSSCARAGRRARGRCGARQLCRSPSSPARPGRCAHAIAPHPGTAAVTQRRLLEWETAAASASRAAGAGAGRGAPSSRNGGEPDASPSRASSWSAIAASGGARRGAADPRAAGCWRRCDRLAAQPPGRSRAASSSNAEDRALPRVGGASTPGATSTTFAGAEDHGLPPDNFQEVPEPRIAHRTSPTNIGMGLLATLAAHDLGFIGTDELVARTDATLTTIEGLERHEGHLLNWYDTQTLAPLLPRYVSTVDSGNLAGALMLPAAGLRGWRDAADGPGSTLAGLSRAPRLRRRDALPFLYDAAAQHLLDRLPARRRRGSRAPRHLLLRPARLRGAAGELRRDRQGRRAAGALVPSRATGHQRRRPPTLLSWSGTLFEYLMPLLVMRSYPGTLLDSSCRMAVAPSDATRPSAACRGGSRSRRTTSSTATAPTSTRPSAFPAWGSKRGLGDELVVAPYATALAAMIDPAAAARNLRRLAALGLRGRATDSTRRSTTRTRTASRRASPAAEPAAAPWCALSRAPPGHDADGARQRAARRAAWSNVSTPTHACAPPSSCCRSACRARTYIAQPRPVEETRSSPPAGSAALRRFRSPHTAHPHAQFLGNGNYTVGGHQRRRRRQLLAQAAR